MAGRNAQPIYVESFAGYTGNGIADDSGAVQAALDAAETAGGGTIVFPTNKTTFIDGVGCAINLTPAASPIIFKGLGNSNLKISGFPGGTAGLQIDNANYVLFEDLNITGETDGASSDGTVDALYYAVIIQAAYIAEVRRCGMFGLGQNTGTAGTGIFTFNQSGVIMKDNFIGGPSTPNTTIGIYDCHSVHVENNYFIDYWVRNGITYNKMSNVGRYGSAVKITSNLAATHALVSPEYRFINNRYDEGFRVAIQADVSAATGAGISLYCQGESCNTGFDFTSPTAVGKYLDVTGFSKVTIKDCVVGYSGQPVEHEAAIFTDCDMVDIDNLQFTSGAKWLTLDGATKRLKIRNSSLQGGTTYDQGWDNSANALIDADTAMPTTDSATALAPKGLTTHVTGTTTITSITTTNLKVGDILTLVFDSTAAINDGNNLKLNAGANFTGGAGRLLVLSYDGTDMNEVARSVN